MNTDFLTTSATVIIPTNIVALSTYDYCTWLDHHIFKDTSLTPTGYGFTYPVTAYGGYFFPRSITFTSIISGGPFYDICYQDFCYESFSLSPINIYCVSNVTFVLSALDESAEKIVKIVYDFGDKSDLLIKNYDYLNSNSTPIKLQPVTHTYYPTDSFVSAYTPRISTISEDGCVSTITLTLCSFKCGIIDLFNDMVLLDAAQSKTVRSIVLTLEDKKQRQIYTNMLDLDAPLPQLSSITNTSIAQAIEQATTIVRASTGRLQFLNPIKADIFNYEYTEGPGINMTPDTLVLPPGSLISSSSAYGITVIDGEGAPYIVGDGLIVTPGFLRTPPLE